MSPHALWHVILHSCVQRGWKLAVFVLISLTQAVHSKHDWYCIEAKAPLSKWDYRHAFTSDLTNGSKQSKNKCTGGQRVVVVVGAMVPVKEKEIKSGEDKEEKEEKVKTEAEEEVKSEEKKEVCLLVGCLTSQQHASVSQGRICTDNFTCCHTEIEAADQTFHLTQSQYTDTGPTSPSADPITPGAWQGSHWSANF